MSATISTKKGTIGMKYIKRSAELIQGAAGDYFKSAMPVSESVLSGAKTGISTAGQALANTTQSVFPKLRQMKAQASIKNINSWFLSREGELGDEAGLDASMTFDIDGLDDEASITEAQISEWDKNANKVSKSVIESSHKMVEAQVVSTANITSSIDKQTAVISAGFDSTNKILGKILEVMTKNTATLIEATVAQSEQKSAKDEMLSRGKFNLGDYKKIVGSNFEHSELAMLAMIPQMLSGGTWKQFVTPETIVSGLFNLGMNKAAPNLKKNMKALDEAVNNVIMTSLIRLGENQSFGPKGMLARLFGIDASRKNVDTSRSSLQIKSVSWDTISREALTNALPGYMRQILIQLGGPDMVYDYRSRTFRTKNAIRKEFDQATTSTGNLARSSNRIRSGMLANNANSGDMQMFYDLMMSDLGSNYTGGSHREFIKSLRSEREVAKYIGQLTSGMQLSQKDLQSQDQFVKNLAKTLKDEWAQVDIANQAASSEVNRRLAGQNYARNADAYNVDISGFEDSYENNRRTIISQYGRKMRKGEGGADIGKETVTALQGLSGTDYTNRALYEIYRRLESGINVFKVGEFEQLRRTHYKKKKALKAPEGYRPTSTQDRDDEKGGGKTIAGIDPGKYDDGTNLLKNNEQEDGTVEGLSKGERFSRWGKNRGKQFAGAMFSGNPEDVKALFGAVVKDVTEVAGGEFKKGISKINTSFGNVSGYLKHKMFGTEYSYQDTDENGNVVTKTVEKNEGGGVFGFIGKEFKSMFTKAKEGAGNWLKEVSSYFDYGDKDEDGAIVSKRKKLIGASVGAFAGAGILGGPIGMLVGGLAGSALTSFGFGKKLKNFLFGVDKETGRPTGILAKAADAVISPIQFQVGKTVTFASAMIKKNILGPLSDIGLAVKDRITNHVSSVFDDIKKAALAPFKKLGGWIVKGVAKAATGMATVGHRVSTTLFGKSARGVIGAGTGAIGFLQNSMARRISKNSFHKLKKGELYPLKVGDKYYDPSEEVGGAKNQRSMVHILDESDDRVEPLKELKGGLGVLLNGDNPKEWRPYSRDYQKWRRKQRNEKIDEQMRSSGYFGKGGVRGFFGGDYKKWHENQYGERAKKLADLQAAMSETLKDQSKTTQEISESSSEIRDILREEQIPGSSFKVHDQGLWDRMDIVIKTLTGFDPNKNSDGTIKKEPKTSGESQDANKKDSPAAGAVLNGEKVVEALTSSSENNERDTFASSVLTSATNAAISGDIVERKEETIHTDIVNEAAKPESNKRTLASKLRELMGIQKTKKEEAGEEKESIWSKILGGLSSVLGTVVNGIIEHPVIAGAIAGLAALGFIDWDNLSSILSWAGNILSTIWDNVKKLFNLDSSTDAVTTGMNMATAVADAQVKDKFDWVTPGATINHNQTDGAGNAIVNSTMTEAKEELLWKTNLRSTFVNGATPAQMINGRLATHFQNVADNARAQASAANLMGEAGVARRAQRRATRAQERADQFTDQANANRNTTTGGIIHNVARVGTLTTLSLGAGNVAEWGAQKLGMSEEGAAIVGNVATGATAAGLTANMATSTLKGKKSFVDKVLDGIIKAFQWLGKKIAGDKAMSKVEGVASKISNLGDNIVKAIKTKIEGYVAKLLEKLGFSTAEQAVSAATLGIGIAVGALNGLASGVCDTEHLFGVLPDDADAGMITISSLLGTAFGALEMTPVVGWIVAIFDIIDAILTALPPITIGEFTIGGIGIKQMLARGLYSLCGGGATLAEKQEAFAAEKQYYQDTYLGGAQMNDSTFNDMVNTSGGWVQQLWEGKTGYDENGHLTYDEAGAVLKSGGVKGFFVGGEKAYAHDAEGNILRDDENRAIQAVDRYGRGIKKDAKWGDAVGNWFSDAGRFLFGGNEYEVDENGEAIRGENGELTVKKREGNIFQKGWSAVTNWWGGKEIENPDGTTTKTEGFKDAAGKVLGNIGATIAKPFQEAASGVKDWWSGSVETDENGEPILDEKGNPVRKGGFAKMAGSTLGKIGSSIANVSRGVKATVTDWVMGEYERDEDGNPLLDENNNPIRKGGLAGWVKTGLGKLNESFVQPAKEMINGAKDWVKDKAEWVKDGLSSAGAWIAEKAGNVWDTISTPVKDFANGAKEWLGNAGEWIGDKAQSVGAWVSEKASSVWTTISTPVKDAVKGASDWVKDKAEWVSDKAKSAGAWIADKASTIFTSITDNVKGLAKGAKDWVKDKADWVKDGVKSAGDWIAEKAKGIWDWVTGPIKELSERGEQDSKDSAYIANAGGPIGGPTGKGGVGGSDDIWNRGSQYSGIGAIPAATKAVASAADAMWERGSKYQGLGSINTDPAPTAEGGNPLNKAFGISSKYGWRVLNKGQEFHSGIDMYPTDGSKQAEVGARFNGEVTSVKSNLPDSHTGLGVSSNTAGNYVIYKTDSGMTIKNFHLKANSIPSNIKPGARVSVGDKIGDMGSTGRSTGPHLHYQMESPNVTDAKGNHTFDPTSSVNGGSTMSSFNDYGNSSYTSDDGSATVSDPTGGKTGIAGIIEVLKNLGTSILNKITGGLFGSTTDSSSSSSLSSSNYGSSYEGALSLSGANVTNVDEFLAMVAKEIGTCESPANSNNVKYNTWYYGKSVSGSDYPWCMAFVQWCFHQAGLDLERKTAGCSDLLSWYRSNYPNLVFDAGTGTPKPGDIVIFGTGESPSHTGIIEKVNSNSSITTIEGNTSSGSSGSQDNGGCVARKQRTTPYFKWYIRAVDFEGLKAAASLASVEGDEAMYLYLRSIGYSPEAATAIVACWAHESTNSAKTVESDYLQDFKNTFGNNYDEIASNIPKFNSYSSRVAKGRSGYIDKRDGKNYAGLGYAQWTGGRSRNLLDFAKQKGLKWYDSGTQLAFMDQEMQSSYKNTYNKLMGSNTIDTATHAFAYGYEHGKMPTSMYQARLSTARSLYPKLKGLNAGGVGGPTSIISDDQSLKRADNSDKGIIPSYSDAHTNYNIGGPAPSRRSSISSTNWARRPGGVGGPSDDSTPTPYSVQPRTIGMTYGSPSTPTPTSSDTNLDAVIRLMGSILTTLIDIRSNTGSSSDLLSSLNEKDFVDKELRDTLSAVGKVSKSNTGRHMSSGSNASQVVAMARP